MAIRFSIGAESSLFINEFEYTGSLDLQEMGYLMTIEDLDPRFGRIKAKYVSKNTDEDDKISEMYIPLQKCEQRKGFLCLSQFPPIEGDSMEKYGSSYIQISVLGCELGEKCAT